MVSSTWTSCWRHPVWFSSRCVGYWMCFCWAIKWSAIMARKIWCWPAIPYKENVRYVAILFTPLAPHACVVRNQGWCSSSTLISDFLISLVSYLLINTLRGTSLLSGGPSTKRYKVAGLSETLNGMTCIPALIGVLPGQCTTTAPPFILLHLFPYTPHWL